MKPGTPEFNDTTPAPLERTGTPYGVTWTIDIDEASSAHDAAQQALNAILRPGSIAHVFSVRHNPTRVTELVDLDKDAPLERTGTPLHQALLQCAEALREMAEAMEDKHGGIAPYLMAGGMASEDAHDLARDARKGLRLWEDATKSPRPDSSPPPAPKPVKTVNLTPRGCMTPEGCERVAKAEQGFLNAKSALANWTANLCRELAGNSGSPREGAQALLRSLDRERGRSGMDYGIDAEELAELLQHNRDAEEEFVRAVAGRPARTPSKA